MAYKINGLWPEEGRIDVGLEIVQIYIVCARLSMKIKMCTWMCVAASQLKNIYKYSVWKLKLDKFHFIFIKLHFWNAKYVKVYIRIDFYIIFNGKIKPYMLVKPGIKSIFI